MRYCVGDNSAIEAWIAGQTGDGEAVQTMPLKPFPSWEVLVSLAWDRGQPPEKICILGSLPFYG